MRVEPPGTDSRADADPLLTVRGVGRDYEIPVPWLDRVFGGRRPQILRAVDRVSFTLDRGRTLGLVGESGCGKSTLARLVAGLEPPSRGSIEFGAADVPLRRQGRARPRAGAHLQMIFQDPFASLNPRWRVHDIIAEPLRVLQSRRDPAVLRARVAELLLQVGLTPADGHRYPHEFSGGQRQRISIARAISSHPQLLICDEPTSSLDVSVQAQIINLLKDLQRRLGLSYLFISHNLAVVAHIADRVGVMYLGRVIELADARELFAHPKHPYTRMLMDAIPDLDMRQTRRKPISGEVPSPLDPPAGCAFHPRCPFADERCRREQPELAPIAPTARLVACHGVAEGRLESP
jgi:peptide/nickel transport system ATP-binding protein